MSDVEFQPGQWLRDGISGRIAVVIGRFRRGDRTRGGIFVPVDTLVVRFQGGHSNDIISVCDARALTPLEQLTLEVHQNGA